jgi:hypothetical protein
MALLFSDNFKSYAATADLQKKWSLAASPWAWSATGGPDGGPCATVTGNGVALASPAGIIPASTTRWCMGFWMKCSSFLDSGNFLVFATNTGAQQFFLTATQGGYTFLWNNSAATFLKGVRNIEDNQWHWIEIDINTVNTSVVKLYVDGVLEYNGPQQGNMNSVFIDRFQFQAVNTKTLSIGGVVLWDNTGSGLTAASFPLGPRDIATIRPDSDGAVAFTRSSGSTNFSLVDDVAGDTTDWVESNVSGAQDLYGYSALGFNPASINAVMVNTFAHNPLPGVINHQAVCKSGATTLVGTSKLTPAVTPMTNLQPFDLDPNGNVAWTQTNLDAAQFGVKVV